MLPLKGILGAAVDRKRRLCRIQARNEEEPHFQFVPLWTILWGVRSWECIGSDNLCPFL